MSSLPEIHISGRVRYFLMLTAFLLPLFCFCMIRSIHIPSGENSGDAYYHAAMAQAGPSVFCAKKFPQLKHSIWHDHFSDKELLYHTLLCGIFRMEQWFGQKIAPPFHFAALFYMALCLAAFLWVLIRMNIHPLLWVPMTLLCGMTAPAVLIRILMLRPHVFSLTLLLLECGILLNGNLRKRLCWTFAISVLYAWSYSNPHFILFPVLLFAFTGIPKNGAKNLWLPAVSAAGVLAGLTLHPQFPNSFLIWKVQSWDAVVGPILSGNAGYLHSLLPPQEMLQPGLSFYRDNWTLFAILYFSFLIFSRLIAAKGWKSISSEYYTLALLALAYSAGTCIVQRTIEYAGCFTILFFASVLDLALKEKVFLPGRENPFRFCKILCILSLLVSLYSAVITLAHTGLNTPESQKFGKWLDKNLPQGTVIVNLNWGDFPVAFYGCRKQVFFWGMDPVFSIAKDAKVTRRIEEALLKPEYVSPRMFYRLTGTRYALVLSKRESYIKRMKSLGWRTLYEAEDGALFFVE